MLKKQPGNMKTAKKQPGNSQETARKQQETARKQPGNSQKLHNKVDNRYYCYLVNSIS